MLATILIGAVTVMNSAPTPSAKDATPITVEETGVAGEYEATKKIVCGDVEWYVDWKSGAERGSITGTARVSIAGQVTALSDFQAKILDRLATVDDISATCNKSADGKSVRTSLLVAGNELQSGKRSLGQVHVGPGTAVQWTFDTV